MELSSIHSPRSRLRARPAAHGQRGSVVFVAVIILVLMTLAGLALMRQMSAGTSIAGNVAFKESATSVADRGIEVARVWITTPGRNTKDDSFADGYHSAWGAVVDPNAFDWANESVEVVAADDLNSTGNTVRVMIHRLCELPGVSANDVTQRCSDGVDPSAGGGSKGGGSYGTGPPPTPLAFPYYRVTARVEGPRKTLSYVQVILQ